MLGCWVTPSPLAGEGARRANEGSGRHARPSPSSISFARANLSRNRSKPAPDGANPSSGPIGRSSERPSFDGLWGHLPPQGGKGQPSPACPLILVERVVERLHRDRDIAVQALVHGVADNLGLQEHVDLIVD